MGADVVSTKDVLKYCLNTLEGVVLAESWGETGVFYNPNLTLKRGVYILTIKEKDGENDKASCLNREGVYRVNLGVRKKTFVDLFGEIPKRPNKGGVVDMAYDFTALDCILPHPVYAWMGWICCLNPTEETFAQLKPYINEAYAYAVEKYQKKG